MKKLLGVVAVAAAGYLACWPVALDPEGWTPDPVQVPSVPADLSLATSVAYELGPRHSGPEDLAMDAKGNLFFGTEEGNVLRWSNTKHKAAPFAHTGGRPLGIEAAADGSLWVADAVRGLVRVETSGAVREVLTEVGGEPLRFVDDVAIGPDGILWVTEASRRYGFDRWPEDILESRPNGRLIRFAPRTGQAEVALDGLYFANGVAVDADNRFVLVVESSRYRVRRLWLSGPRAGTDEIWVRGLPGVPDGITRGSDGIFWLAMASGRSPVLDGLAEYPAARKMIARIPGWMALAPPPQGAVWGLDGDGQVRYRFEDPKGEAVAWTTHAVEIDGALYIAALHGHHFARLDGILSK